jgi:dihydrofolate reductase
VKRVVYAFNMSLDGYIEDRHGGIEWTEPDEEVHRYYNDFSRRFGTEVYGRRLWETMSSFWPTADQDMSLPEYIREFSTIWKQSDKVVVSRTLDRVDGARLIKDNVVEEIRKLKYRDGRDIGIGGAILAETLIKAGLVDEFMCLVHPVVLGGGKPMFTGIDSTKRLKLTEVRRFNAGGVLLHYHNF